VSFVFFFNEFADWKFTTFIPFNIVNIVVAIKIIAIKSGVVAMNSGVFLKYNYSNILYKENTLIYF
jgi:hypothetical protein